MLSNYKYAMYPFQKKYSHFAEQMSNAEQSGDELLYGTQKPRSLPGWPKSVE